MMDKRDERLKKLALNPDLEVTARVGKAGLTDALINEIDCQLKSRKLVKVKVNRGLAENRDDRRALWDALAQSTDSKLVVMRGNIAVFTRQ